MQQNAATNEQFRVTESKTKSVDFFEEKLLQQADIKTWSNFVLVIVIFWCQIERKTINFKVR